MSDPNLEKTVIAAVTPVARTIRAPIEVQAKMTTRDGQSLITVTVSVDNEMVEVNMTSLRETMSAIRQDVLPKVCGDIAYELNCYFPSSYRYLVE